MEKRTVKFVELKYEELGLDDEVVDQLYEMGLGLIKDDKPHVVEYALNQMFTEFVSDEEPSREKIVDIIKDNVKIYVE